MTRAIYAISNASSFSGYFALRDLIGQASMSITCNIAEGSVRGGNNEFFQFASLTKGTSCELRSLVCVALDAGYIIDQQMFDRLPATATQINRLLACLRKYLRGSEYIRKREQMND